MENLKAALIAVENGVSLRKAAAEFGLNRQTISNRMHGLHSKSVGGQQKFTLEEEATLVNLLKDCANLGTPLEKKLLIKLVVRLGIAKGLKLSKFSDCWHRYFLKRNSSLVLRITHSSNRKKEREWSESCAEMWLDLLGELDSDGYLEEPTGLWNLDETAFKLAEAVRLVYAEKGTKDVLSYMDGSERDMVSVLACGNASGNMLRPLILFDGKVHVGSRFDGTEDKCYLGINSSGVMDGTVFTRYVVKELLPNMTASKNVIFLDGHSSHISNEEFLYACLQSEKKVKVVCFPAGQTGKLQPLDRSVFGPVKKHWRDFLRFSYSRINEQVTRQTFPAYLMELWFTFNLSNNLQSGFRNTGLFPFDPKIIGTTVKGAKVGIPQISIFARTYEKELREIKFGLQQIHAFTWMDVDDLMRQVMKKGEGGSTLPTVDVASELRDVLMDSRPAKKKHVKDSRLDTKYGSILTSTSYLDALNDHNSKKTATAGKKAAAKPKNFSRPVLQSLENMTELAAAKKLYQKKEMNVHFPSIFYLL